VRRLTPGMSEKTECRLLIDPPAPGAWNMAVDEVLLESSAEAAGCCWRFYQWDEPTLSFGYFQQYEERSEHAASRGCPAVRRLTGGGAIVHDAELTYSLVVPGGHPLAAGRHGLYEAVHRSLIESLAEFGVAAVLCEGSPHRGQDRQPLLCFERRATGDVLVGPTKIAGSAQRRRRAAVLQHGSLLLRRSPAAPELAGLEDVAPTGVGWQRLAEVWLDGLADRLAVAWRRDRLSQHERDRAAALVENRYDAARWTINRQR
jgi:lipoate-protein ligase A